VDRETLVTIVVDRAPARVAAEAARISELARLGDLTTPAPWLGRWRVRDVVAHLGGVHRWATRIVETRSMDGPGFTKSKLDGIALCDWFDEGAAALAANLAEVDPDEACPNFNPGSARTMAFWLRRQTHETTVHRWDVEQALGAVTPIEEDVAVDGIDEYLDIWVRSRGKHTLAAPLTIRASEVAWAWTLMPDDRPGRVQVEVSTTPTTATSAVSADPGHLLLWLWGRSPLPDSAVIDGDPTVVASFRP
jgi:uncharacterized protein (TIGR03083 family)